MTFTATGCLLCVLAWPCCTVMGLYVPAAQDDAESIAPITGLPQARGQGP